MRPRYHPRPMTESRQEKFSGTKEVAERLRFDAATLQRYLEEHVEGFSGELQVRQFRGGQSCPTYLLEAGGKSYVLRRKPPGKLLPSAHAVDREYRVMAALGLPTLEQYRDAYCRRTGRDGIPHWNFYLAYNLFRSARHRPGHRRPGTRRHRRELPREGCGRVRAAHRRAGLGGRAAGLNPLGPIRRRRTRANADLYSRSPLNRSPLNGLDRHPAAVPE